MRALRRFFARLKNLLFHGNAERELTREVTAHLTLLQDQFESRGITLEDAKLAARRAYGGVEQVKELHRAERSFIWLEQLLQDLRHACRGLAKSPGFTALAVIALALGIGVNTTLFSGYNAIALKPFPVADPDRVAIFKRWFERRGGTSRFFFSYPEYVYCRDHSDQFSSLVAASWRVSVLGSFPGSAATERLTGQLVSANYFPDLGIRPFMGRGFLAGEDRNPGADSVAVISYPFWKREFSGDPRVLGQAMKLNGTAFTVIGIAPESFTGTSVDAPVTPDFWAPLSMQAQLVPGQNWLNRPELPEFQILARLKPSTDRRAAQAQVDLLVRQFATTYAETVKTTAVILQRTAYLPSADDFNFKAAVAAVMLVVGLVLFVACANVGNMLLARGAGRQREISTRLALGAGRARIVCQLLAESVLLSCLGGLAGLLIAHWSMKLLEVYLQQTAAGKLAINLAPDLRVIAYVLAVSLSAGVLFGLSPALQFTKPDLTTALKNEGASLGDLGGSRLRGLLVAAQVAISMFLLASAGLLTRGLLRSQAADPGFETRHVFMLTGDFGENSDPAKAVSRKRLLAERLRDRPELGGGALGGHPLNGGEWDSFITVGNSREQVMTGFASDTYLDVVGIPLLLGRNFTAEEASAGSPVVLVSESTARRFWPNEDPLGKSFTLDWPPSRQGSKNQPLDRMNVEVIGIVKDVRFSNITRVDATHIYLPSGGPRAERLAMMHHSLWEVLVRFQGDRQQALSAIGTTVEASDKDLLPSLGLINLEDEDVGEQRAASRSLATLATTLAALALTLAGLGIYGVIAYLVSQRTREIGIRMALGANARAVLKNIVLQGLRPVFVGLILGTAAAAGLSAVLHLTLVFEGSMDFLYGLPFYDPITFIGLFCFVLGIAALASAVPARRALGVDPIAALRYE